MATRKQSARKGTAVVADAVAEKPETPAVSATAGRTGGTAKAARKWDSVSARLAELDQPGNPVCRVVTDLQDAPELHNATHGNAPVFKGPENIAVTSDGKEHAL